MRTIQCPKCLAYGQGDYPAMAALPNHRTARAPDMEFDPVESRNDPELCPASEGLVHTQPSEKPSPRPSTLDPRRIESLPWTELHSYEFNPFPDTLIVTTNANRATFDAAAKQLAARHADGDMVAIEEILRAMGHAAITGQRDPSQVVPSVP